MPALSEISRDQALALHRGGEIDRAMAAYRTLLERQPGDADLLGLLGVASEQIGQVEEAEHLLRLSLRDPSPLPIVFRNLNNLIGLLIEAGRPDEARSAAERHLPGAWPAGRVPDAVEQGTLLSLVSALKDLDLADKALALGFPLLPWLGEDIDFALLIANLLHDAGNGNEAAAVLARDFGPGEDLPNLHLVRAALAHERDDRAGCAQASSRFAACMPILLAEASPSQHCVLAVLNKAVEFVAGFQDPYQLHYSGNFPAQLADAFAGRFRFLSILANSPTAADALRDMPRPGLVLNNVVNAEQLMVENTLAEVGALADGLGVTVINHPRLAVQATRQKNAERFANVPGIHFPKVHRYRSDRSERLALIRDIEERCGYPVIIRTVFHQMGDGTWLTKTRDELAELLDRLEGMQFYAIRYIETRHGDGAYRAFRAAFVGGQAILIRADHSDRWNVRARRDSGQQAFYAAHPQLLRRANAIVRDPQAELGQSLFEKLGRVAGLMPLDIFGMDFDVTDAGDLLIFEANATMNLLSTSPDGLEYPPEIEERLRDMLERYLLSHTDA